MAPRTPKAAPRKRTPRSPGRGVAPMVDEDRVEPEENLRTRVEAYVAQCIKEAIEWRASTGVEQEWAEDTDQYEGEDDVTREAFVKTSDQRIRVQTTNGSRVYLNITAPKVDSAAARVQEMLVPTNEQPFDIQATPIPELDEVLEDPAHAEEPVQLADGSTAPASVVALKAKDDAAKRAGALLKWVEDKFIEGDVYSHMRRALDDAPRKGTGVLKGPIPVERVERRWRKDAGGVFALEITKRIEPTSRRVPVENCFPAPDCGESIHDGSYFIERDYMNARKLRDLMALPEYDADAIKQALQDGPQRGNRTRAYDSSLAARRHGAGDPANGGTDFEVFYFYGWIDPVELQELGIDRGRSDDEPPLLSEDDLTRPYLPAIVTLVNGRAIRATLNPLETGDFPYDFIPWRQVEGRPWGKSLTRMMQAPQRVLVAATRRLMENGGLSAGPQVVVAKDSITPADGREEITGRKLWYFTSTDTVQNVQQAMAVFNIPSAQAELSAIIQFALDMADRLTNLPLLMQGEQQAGTSPETFGGMKLLVQNSTSTLRRFAKLYDDLLIVPHLKRYNDWCMERGPEEARGDAEIKAKGATELVQREEDAEFMVMLWSMQANPELRINPVKLAEAMARTRRFDLSTVQYSEDEWTKKQEEAQANPPPQDPALQVATMRLQAEQAKAQAAAQDAQADRQFKAQQGEQERAMKLQLAEIDRQIQIMELSGSENIEISKIKAALAQRAADHRMKAEEMQLKLNPENPSGLGI